MRAYQITSFDRPGQLATMPQPIAQKGQCLLRISACGLNFADLLMQKGTYQDTPEPPFCPGLEVCGVIESLGPDTNGPAIGTRVAAFIGSGGLAEYAVVDVDRLVPVPDEMPDEIAAGFQIAYGTSHVALTHTVQVQKNQRLLVLGAAGGVGLTAVEIGAQLGAEVIAVARGAEKLQIAAEAGATHLIDADPATLRDAVKALGGADVVYDAVGGDMFTAALRATNPDGKILLIGFASGQVPEIKANHLLVKNISVHGLYWGGYLRFAPKVLTDSMTALFQMYADGGLKPHVSHVLPLDQTAEALDLLRTRRSTGKVVVSLR